VLASASKRQHQPADNVNDNVNDNLYINNIYKSDQEIKDRVYELYDRDTVSNNIKKYKLLVLFITK
jgi:hypothetical protein